MANRMNVYIENGRAYDKITGNDITDNLPEIIENSKNKRVYRIGPMAIPNPEQDELIRLESNNKIIVKGNLQEIGSSIVHNEKSLGEML